MPIVLHLSPGQAIADVEKSKADLAANNARTIEVEAEMELAVAKPALMAAHEAVNCLDKASLTELKSFSKVLQQKVPQNPRDEPR